MRRAYRLKRWEGKLHMRLPGLDSLTLSGSRSLGERCRNELWKKLMSLVVEAVNQRGICAVEMAQLAELPQSEVDSLRERCSCPGCFSQRAN